MLFPSGRADTYAPQRGIQFFPSLQHGLHWGVVAGVLVGLAAMLAVIAGPARRTPVDSSGATQR